MLRRSIVVAVVGSAALVGSAAAFSPMMSMETGRRQVVQAGAAAATVAPLLRSKPAEASNFRPGFPGRAPVITVFDHRGCTSHSNVEYTGEPAKRADAKDKKFKYNGEDEMLVREKPFGLPRYCMFVSSRLRPPPPHAPCVIAPDEGHRHTRSPGQGPKQAHRAEREPGRIDPCGDNLCHCHQLPVIFDHRKNWHARLHHLMAAIAQGRNC